MKESNIRIIQQNIRSSNIFISQDLSKQFDLNMECKAEMKTSKNEEDKSILLSVKLAMTTEDENLKIALAADVFFELEEVPDDYNEIAEKKLVPMARESLLESLDEILVIMGYHKMELVKKI